MRNSNHIEVKGHNNLVRDRRSGAILNTNKTEIERARMFKKVQQEKDAHITNLTNEIDTLRTDMDQMKELLISLVEVKNAHR
tara:strand:+ start:275 stop:520 length:246 start_codon:yes stop_codon:yes gene_type:complete